MNRVKTRVFLTGATGVMGSAGLDLLMKYPLDYDVTILARPSKKNQKQLKPYIGKGVKVIWGDLLDKVALKKGIQDSDIVLHVGGMVSPMAEHYPEKTMKVNVGSMELIADIVKGIENADPDRIIKVVYIGSVSQYGSKLPPHHWGKVGDPLKAAKFDAYSESKIKAEQQLMKAGLKQWVSIRQTSILHPGLLKNAGNPVIFHTPLCGVLEWITIEDSARILERICRKDLPDSFWGKCYNAGGGEAFRKTNLEFERELLDAIGCPPVEKIFEPNWFATQNFHGMWFEDSDALEEILHFRDKEDNFEKAINRLKQSLPFYYKFTPVVPAFLIKPFMRKIAAKSPHGPLSWIKEGNKEKIKASWGSLEEYRKISDWKDFKVPDVGDRKTPPKETV